MAEKTQSTAVKKKALDPASSPGADLAAVVSMLLEGLPGVTTQRKFHNTTFLVKKKVFAFTRPDGAVLKLPEVKIRELMDTRPATPLVMGRRVMREWVVLRHDLRHDDPGAYRKDKKLFLEAMAFVSSLSK